MIPKLPRRTIVRERLLEQLHRAIGNGVTVVEAPAGYGKSVLLAQFAGDVDFAVRWLSLDSSSGAPEVLAHQLGIALSGNCELEPPATALKASDAQAYVYAEAGNAARRSELPLLLVVDNIHELIDARESTALLEWMIACAPDGMEILLAGRERPFLPELNERIATGELVVVDTAALTFTVDEIRKAASPAERRVDAAAVLAATGGWPVGVMAALYGSSDAISASAFEQYLDREVWTHVPAEVRAALRRFSLQPTITRVAVEESFGTGTWRSLAAWIASREFLCEHLSPNEFRLNPLLRQFIAAEFDQLDPDGYARAVEDVVDEMVAAGHVSEAVEFTRSGGSEQQLADLLEKHSSQLIVQGAFTLLLRAFECISEPTQRRRPMLRAVYTRVVSHMQDPEDAERRANAILKDERMAPEHKAHALLAKIRSLRLLGRLDDAQAAVEELSELSPLVEPAFRAEVDFQRAEFELSVRRDFLKAEELLTTVVDSCERQNIEPLGLLARSTLGQSLAMRGDAPAAVTVLTRAARGWRNLGRSSNLGWVLNNLGMSHLQAGDFASAATVLREAVAEGEDCGNLRNVAYATASLGDAEVALGNFEAARVHYEEAIRICATDALDESLAALSIAGLSAALLGAGDLQQADFFSRRALLVALSSANSYEIAMCKVQQAAVEFASGNFVVAVQEALEAADRFQEMAVQPMVAVAHYRIAMAQFKAGKREEADHALAHCGEALTEPWMTATLMPLVRENALFAQWSASRRHASPTLKELVGRTAFKPAVEQTTAAPAQEKFPLVAAHSLGRLRVTIDGEEVPDEKWASARSKEMFFLLLSNREGLRKEEAVEKLYPDLPRQKCNSAFHSNLYRVRRALYQDSVVKCDDGIYQLNPEGRFDWDVEEFEEAIAEARKSPGGSVERASALQRALELYDGPFARAFQSEWSDALRARLEDSAHESLAMLAGYFAGREDYESAAACMERVLRANKFNEEAAYQLARYRTRAGGVIEALRFLDEYARGYVEEFGEDLPGRFGQLRASIAAGVAV
jgi:ATP/maltotriose-dependent transcriptional regulator MalT